MRNKLILMLLGFVALGLFQTCKRNNPAKNFNQVNKSAPIKFIADESFAPILDEELYVFKSQNPTVNADIIYKTENDVVKLLLADSSQFAFMSRKLNDDEVKSLKDHNLMAYVSKFAEDAVAIIVNEASNDTTTSVGEIKKMLTGAAKTDKSIVFDNPNSSLVRYLKDFAGEKEFKQKNIYALKSSKEVIDYVSKHPDAIGITGYTWLNDPDADYAEAVKKVKIVAVKDENSKESPNQYFKPSQTTLSLKQYPLKRDLYIVNSLGSKSGTEAMFEHFIVSDRGQRIILRSGLLPVIVPGREIIIHSNKL